MRKFIAVTLGVALAGVGTIAMAARNASGTHTLPLSNPVVPGTKITAAWANALTADLSAEITDSLSRSGKGGMTAALRGTDGSAAAPAFSFTGETGSGWYRQAAGNVRLAVTGADALQCTSTSVVVPVALTVNGAASMLGAFAMANGATLTSGNLTMMQAAGQSVTKSGGSLTVGTSDANALALRTGGSDRFTIDATGDMTSAGGKITGLPTPTVASDAATKGYVDTSAPASGKAIAAGTVGSDGVASGVFGATTSRSSAGVYVVTLTAATANYAPVVTLKSASAGFAIISATGASQITVKTYDTGSVLTDTSFTFIVLAGP